MASKIQDCGDITLSTSFPIQLTIEAGVVYRFRIHLTEVKKIQFYTSGTLDTYGYLSYDDNVVGERPTSSSNSSVIMNNDDTNGHNFSLQNSFWPDLDQYLYVQGYSETTTGTTTLNATFATSYFNFVDCGVLNITSNPYTQSLNYNKNTIYRYTISNNNNNNNYLVSVPSNNFIYLWASTNAHDCDLFLSNGGNISSSTTAFLSKNNNINYLFIKATSSANASGTVLLTIKRQFWEVASSGYDRYDDTTTSLTSSAFASYNDYQLTRTIEPNKIYRITLRRYNNSTSYYYSPLEITASNRGHVNVWLSTNPERYDVYNPTSGYEAGDNCWINTGTTNIRIDESLNSNSYSTYYYLYIALDNSDLTEAETITLNIKQKFYNFQPQSTVLTLNNSTNQELSFTNQQYRNLFRYKIVVNDAGKYNFNFGDYIKSVWISDNKNDYDLYLIGGTNNTDNPNRRMGTSAIDLTTGTYYLYFIAYYSNTSNSTYSIKLTIKRQFWEIVSSSYDRYDDNTTVLTNSAFTSHSDYQLTRTIEPNKIYRITLRRYNNSTSYYYSPLEITASNRGHVNVWLSMDTGKYDRYNPTSGYEAGDYCWINTGTTNIRIDEPFLTLNSYSTYYYLYIALDNADLTEAETITLNIKQKFYNFQPQSTVLTLNNSTNQELSFTNQQYKNLFRYKIIVNDAGKYNFKFGSNVRSVWISDNKNDYDLYLINGKANGSRITGTSTLDLTTGTYYLYFTAYYSNTSDSTYPISLTIKKQFWEIVSNNSIASIGYTIVNNGPFSITINLGPNTIYKYQFYLSSSSYYGYPLHIWSTSDDNADIVGWFATSNSAYDLYQESNSSNNSLALYSDDNSNGNNQFKFITDPINNTSTRYIYISPKNLTSFNGENKNITLYIGRLYYNFNAIDTPVNITTNNQNISLSFNNSTIYRYTITAKNNGQYYFSSNNNYCYLWISNDDNDYNQYAKISKGTLNFSQTLEKNQTYYLYVRIPSNADSSGQLTLNVKKMYWDFVNTDISLTLTEPLREINLTVNPSVIYRMAFHFKSSSYAGIPLAIYSIAKEGTSPDIVGWLSSNSDSYNQFQTNNSMTLGEYYDDNSNSNNQFKITTSIINDTNERFLYISSAALNSFTGPQTIKIIIKDPSIPDQWGFQTGENISLDNIQYIRTISSRIIYQYPITVPSYKNYNISITGSSDIVSWLSSSSNAYDISSMENSQKYADFDIWKGTNNIGTALMKNQEYYLYISSKKITNNFTNIQLTIKGTGATISSNVSVGRVIYTSIYNNLISKWNTLCKDRNHYGNISSRSGTISTTSQGAYAVSNQLQNKIQEFNKYFYSPIITVINQSDTIDADQINEIYRHFDSPGLCRIACTGSCTTTQSHTPEVSTTTNYNCVNCDTTCSGTCALTACKGGCYQDCSGGCDDGCSGGCKTDCIHSNQSEPGSTTTSNCSDCAAVCSKTCENSCNSFCGKDCSGSCGRYCTDDCSGNCGRNGCTQSCAIGCITLCGDRCSSTCDSWCWNQSTAVCSGGCLCSGYCDSLCGSQACGGKCTGDCTNQCSGNCKDRCVSDCIGSCSSECFSCTDTCSGTCSSCTNSCSSASSGASSTTYCSGCDGQCGSDCSGGCHNQCGDACGSECADGCLTGCKTTCSTNCSKGCSVQTQGSASSSTSYGPCHNSCTDSCATSCSDTCVISNTN